MNKLAIISFLLFISIIHTSAQVTDDSLNINKNRSGKKTVGISFHSGFYKLKADIPSQGLGLGIRLQVPVNSLFSLRFNYFASSVKGISAQPWTHSTITSSTPVGGGLVENIYAPYIGNIEGWFPSYKFTQSTIELEGLVSLTKLLNKQLALNINFFDLYILGSYGFFGHITGLDLLDANGTAYNKLLTNSGWTPDKFDTKVGRKGITDKLNSIYDGKYETEIQIFKKNRTYSYGGGLRFNINPTIGLGLEYKIINYKDFDYADGIRFRSANELTLDNDSARYTSLFLEIKF